MDTLIGILIPTVPTSIAAFATTRNHLLNRRNSTLCLQVSFRKPTYRQDGVLHETLRLVVVNQGANARILGFGVEVRTCLFGLQGDRFQGQPASADLASSNLLCQHNSFEWLVDPSRFADWLRESGFSGKVWLRGFVQVSTRKSYFSWAIPFNIGEHATPLFHDADWQQTPPLTLVLSQFRERHSGYEQQGDDRVLPETESPIRDTPVWPQPMSSELSNPAAVPDAHAQSHVSQRAAA
jgi:hypothetical protein